MTSNAFQRLRDQDTLDEFGTAIRLPFNTLTVRVLNGSKAMRDAENTARYYGGFAYDQEQADEVGISLDWKKYRAPISNPDPRNEDPFYTEAANTGVNVAIIKGRSRWIQNGTGLTLMSYPKDGTKARKHLQYLAGLFVSSKEKPEGEFRGMCLLTAKGLQVDNLTKAVKTWHTAIRRLTANTDYADYPRAAWIISLGVETTKPNFVTVGSGRDTSEITPIVARLPKADLTLDLLLKNRLVSDATAEFMADRAGEALEWFDAWRKMAEASSQPTPAQAARQTHQRLDEPPFNEDDFDERPF